MGKTLVLDKAELRRLLASKMNKPNVTLALQESNPAQYDLVMVSDINGRMSLRSVADLTANSEGGQENVLERVKVNGAFLPIQNKVVDIVVPTKVSDLADDIDVATMLDIPENLSELDNDVGYIKQSDIPTNVGSFSNDAGYITRDALPAKVSDLENDVDYLVASDVASYQDAINTINLQFPLIADSIRDIRESVPSMINLRNEFVSYEEHVEDLDNLVFAMDGKYQPQGSYVKTSDIQSFMGLKIFRATVVMTSDTSHVINYAAAGFTEVPTISLTAHSNDPGSTAAETGNYSTIVSKTSTQCVIRNNGAISVGLVGTVNTSRTATVDIIAIGK